MKNGNGMKRVFLIDGVRIPFQKSETGYADLKAYDLARMAIKGLADKSGVDPASIAWVILGTTISNVSHGNVARDAALAAGIPHGTPAFTVTLACVSANRAITSGVELIRTGQGEAVIAGGTDSVSDIPITYRKKLRKKLMETRRYRSPADYLKFFKGLSLKDLLPEVPSVKEFTTDRTMGEDCERLAARFGVTREEQDIFAARSHRTAAAAWKEGLFSDEVIPVQIPPGFKTIKEDNGIRGDTGVESLSKLKPAFSRPFGTLTAGNASFLTDGAAAVLIGSEDFIKASGLAPKAEIIAYTYTSQDVWDDLLLGPAYAAAKLLDMTGMAISDIGVFEFHEAFAAQVLANVKCLDSDAFARERLGKIKKTGAIPIEKLNARGGSLSIGHPFGATGARLVTTAANRLAAENAEFALVAACAGGAHGHAMILKRT